KTLMSRKDGVVDLPGDHSRATEKDLMHLRTQVALDTGLLVLYPIDKDSEPATARAAETREPLAAEEHAIGVGLVFPEVLSGDVAAHGYIQADLAGISIEDEDYSALEDE